MRRLVCIVEGHGELDAAPVLCNRVLRRLLGVTEWYVDEEPIRQPRSRLVNEAMPSPRRGVNELGLRKALALAASRAPDAALVLCDADDDCPAVWGPQIPSSYATPGGSMAVGGVMACREFESWLLWGFPAADRARVHAANPEHTPRDAKRVLGRLVPGYTPTTHQLSQTRSLQLDAVWAGSDSFDKFVRSVATLTGSSTPLRPQR